jgi:hypothetical protein
MKRIIAKLLVISLAAVLFWGCEKKGDPPVLPSVETMKIDFSNFTDAGKSAIIDLSSKGVENANWALAATVAGVWNSILIINLAIPVAAFNLAVNEKPVYLADKKWEWRYSLNVVGATYNARLTGQISENDVKWEMYLEREGIGGFGEFLWFDGSSGLDGKSGQWILNHSSQFPEPMLQIDWTWDGEKIGSVRYEYIRDLKDNRTADPFKESYIEYGLTSDPLDAYYDVHFYESAIIGDFVDVNIKWNTTGHNGSVKAPYFFQDNEWHCWDGNGNDASCLTK